MSRRKRKAASSLIAQRKHRVLGVLLVALAVLVFVSLISYDPGDPVDALWSRGAPVSNAGGAAGALVAWVLRKWFGVASLALPVVLLAFGLNRLFVRPVGLLVSRSVLGVLILTLVVALFTVPLVGRPTGDVGDTLGGRFGRELAGIAVRVFGPIGVYPVLLALLLLTAMATVRWSPAAVFARTADWWERRSIERHRRAIERRKARAEAERIDAERREREAAERREAVSIEPPTDEPPAEELADEERETVAGEESAAHGVETQWVLPSLELLDPDDDGASPITDEEADRMGRIVEEKLAEFDIAARYSGYEAGPVITLLEFVPDRGVKLSRITSLSDDLSLALKSSTIRILAPIPGKAAIGVEVPNPRPLTVGLRGVLESRECHDSANALPLVVGRTAAGAPMVLDLSVLPHILVAGATGSGKSVGINSFVLSLVYRHTPDALKFIMVDPKRIELVAYSGLPHLLTKVVTDAKEAARALSWAVKEMERRYDVLARAGVRSIADYNSGRRTGGLGRKVARGVSKLIGAGDDDRLPYLVVIIDELADLMMTSRGEVEESIARLAQMARAVGIHLVLATQRPSVDVITGVIKANFATRVAYKVAAKVDSRTILDASGAEELLGRGDLLLMESGQPDLVRCQGAFAGSHETSRVVEFWSAQVPAPAAVDEEGEEAEEPLDPIVSASIDAGWIPVAVAEDDREQFARAARLVVLHQQASVSFLQRKMKLGYPRAGMLIDLLEEAGIVGPYQGTKNREVLWDEAKLAVIDGRDALQGAGQ